MSLPSHQRVLITGGRGFIGAALSAAFAEAGHQVVRLGRSAATRAAPGEDIVGDARDRATIAAALSSVTAVVHLAAETSAAVAARDPVADLANSVVPLVLVLEECARRSDPPVVVLASTVTVYGRPAKLPVGDDAPDAPETTYCLHKRIAESYLRYFVQRGALRGGSLRLANVYGPGPASGAADRGVLNAMVAKALRGETLTVHGRGESLRDYVYVDDVARAFVLAVASAPSLAGGHFVIATGEGHSIAGAVALVAARVEARTTIRVPVVSVEPPPGAPSIDGRDFVGDASRFSALCSWQPRVKLAEGIDRTIAAHLEQEVVR